MSPRILFEPGRDVGMIMPFAYTKPTTIDEALEALQTDNSKPLAGGTALLVDMRDGKVQPDLLVDVKGLEESAGVSVDPDRGLVIGACTTLNSLIEHKRLTAICPAISQAASVTATYQLRNRATLGGNICKASPAADMVPSMVILGAQVVIRGARGERRLPITDFITGVQKNALKRGELVLRVEITPVPRAKMAYLKKQRIRGHDLAIVNVAGLADARSGSLRICVGACTETPVLLKGTDQIYQETSSMEKLEERVAELAVNSIAPIDDVRASAEYRGSMVRAFTKRVVRQICS